MIADIPLVEARRLLRVYYLPIKNDGTRGHRNSVYLPWAGPDDACESMLRAAAVDYFARQFGPGQDEILAFELVPGAAA